MYFLFIKVFIGDMLLELSDDISFWYVLNVVLMLILLQYLVNYMHCSSYVWKCSCFLIVISDMLCTIADLHICLWVKPFCWRVWVSLTNSSFSFSSSQKEDLCIRVLALCWAGLGDGEISHGGIFGVCWLLLNCMMTPVLFFYKQDVHKW